MALRPLHDRVIIQREEEETTTAAGIVLPGSATEKPSRGTVVAVGEGKALDNGQVSKMAVKAGDKVLFGKYAGTEVKSGEDTLIVMREDEIMAIVE